MIKDDALLGTFLAEHSFEQWRKRSTISLEEESASKRIDRVEEMTIPSDLEDKLGYVLHLVAFICFSVLIEPPLPRVRLDMCDRRSSP